jgi:hypothetical protein
MPYYQKDCNCCLIKVHKRDVERFENEESFRRKFEKVDKYFPDSDDSVEEERPRVHWDDDDGEEPGFGLIK